MTDRQKIIAENYKAVENRISDAVNKRGGATKVTLLAATKTIDAEDIIFAADKLNITLAGENRVQEFTDKYDLVREHLDEYHFIGHLQTNKVKYLVGKCELIHSVGSMKLASEISRVAKVRGVTQDILIEINCATEESKSGFLPQEVSEAIEKINSLEAVRLCGIMTMGPAGVEKAVLRKYFRETYKIFIDNFTKKSHNIREPILSMGMSDSFDIAIEEGANLVRVGSAIFGKRLYPAE